MNTRHRTIFYPALGLVLIALLAACGSENDGQTVRVNLSLVVNSRQAAHHGPVSRLFAWIERWFPGATPAWAQSVSDIARIDVQVSGPGIPAPATASVPVSNPTSGQEIPVSIQAPVGPNRTITVVASNGANEKIFGSTMTGVNLAAGAPINLEMVLVRLFTVTVQKHPQGTGSGTVTSTPAGIDCGVTCSGQFEEGTTVALNAAAAPGSTFAGWSGECSGTAACSVTNTATVTARFNVALDTDRLAVIIGGTGSGTVTSNPSGISCPGSCAADFATGTTVTLTATPTNGSTFNPGWSGAGCIGTSPCVVAMVGDQTVTATFTANVPVPMSTLTVQKVGPGSGTVTSQPAGIDCGTTCVAGFSTGTVVTLTATPAAGSALTGWNGPRCGGTGACTITLDSDFTAFPFFDIATDLVTLTVEKQGSGDGTVTSDPAGISCGPGCDPAQASYPRGTTVTLTATPDGDSSFNDWHGGGPCDNSSSPTCQLQMNGNETVSAHFDD